jgi:transcriptional regulator with XRE-family HTH domain
MQDLRLGVAFRAVRVKRAWRQLDVALRAGVLRGLVSDIERGHLDGVTFGALRAVASALEIRVDVLACWRAGELDRLLNAGHSAMHEATAAFFADLDSWLLAPEISFSIYGERGVIDIVAWHAETRTLLVIELKTEIVDVQDLVGTVDRKRRLVAQVVRERGWIPAVLASWVIVAEGSTNRRRVAAHRRMLRAEFPTDGPAVRRWVRDPQGPVDALSFMSFASQDHTRRSQTPRKRIRPPTSDRRVAYETNPGKSAA